MTSFLQKLLESASLSRHNRPGRRWSAQTARGAAGDLSLGADVIVIARIAAVIFLALFIAWVELPHTVWIIVLLAGIVVSHGVWWAMFVRGGRPITSGAALVTLLCDTVGVGVAMALTGGADSPAVLIWAPNVAVAAIWLGVRRSLLVVGVAVAFLLSVGIADPGIAVRLTEVQYAVLAAFMLLLIVVHGGVVAARQRSVLDVLAATEARARRDPLTGLSNRGVFDEQFPVELDRARRYLHPLALLMIDLDNFKAINDTHGHMAGDAVLIDVARHLMREKRRSDTIVRLGGEEFVMLLPETDESAAVSLAERLRERVLASHGGEGVTVSIGVASYPTSATAGRALLRAADDALYEAKRRGKNQTVLFVPPPEPGGEDEAPTSP